MTILVTGCAGFIGKNFTKQFQKQFPKAKVVGIDNFSTGRMPIPKNVTFYKGSITDKKLLAKIFSSHKPEYVFHFAALPRVAYSVEHPHETSETNILGTVALLELSARHKIKRVIYSSSASVYGGAIKLPTRESENLPNPKSPYSLQKYVGEPFCKIFSDLYGIDTVSLRYFNVFGPGQYGDSPYSTIISGWLENLYFSPNKKSPIEGDGNQSRDFCYVDNVINANILAMLHPKKFNGEVFNIAHGERTTVNEVKKMIEAFTGRQLKLEKRPPRAGDIRHSHADVSKAKKWFGYKPAVNFKEGLEKTIQWFELRAKEEGFDR